MIYRCVILLGILCLCYSQEFQYIQIDIVSETEIKSGKISYVLSFDDGITKFSNIGNKGNDKDNFNEVLIMTYKKLNLDIQNNGTISLLNGLGKKGYRIIDKNSRYVQGEMVTQIITTFILEK